MQKTEVTNEVAIEDLTVEEFTVEALEERFEMQTLGGSTTDGSYSCSVEWNP